SLREACWKTEIACESRVFAPAIQKATASGFSVGLWSERLFWRHWRFGGRVCGLISHSVMSLARSIGAPLRMLGPVTPLFQFGHYRHQLQVLAELKMAADEAAVPLPTKAAVVDQPAAAATSDAFIRIDSAHSPASDSAAKKSKSRRRSRR